MMREDGPLRPEYYQPGDLCRYEMEALDLPESADGAAGADEGAAFHHIVKLLQSAEAPLGWYGIAIRLSQVGALTEHNLLTLLGAMVAQGLVRLVPCEGHPHGVYEVTEAGHAFAEGRG